MRTKKSLNAQKWSEARVVRLEKNAGSKHGAQSNQVCQCVYSILDGFVAHENVHIVSEHVVHYERSYKTS